MEVAAALSRHERPEIAAREVTHALLSEMGPAPIDLACLFVSSHFANDVHGLSSSVRETVPVRTLLGCMGEGVIGVDQELEGTPAVVLWAGRFPGMRIEPFRIGTPAQGETIPTTEWPHAVRPRADHPSFLVFADPFSPPLMEFLEKLDRSCPTAPAIGGLTSGGISRGENRLILDDHVYHDGIVGAALAGEVTIRTIVSQGCQPIGERYIVTRAEDNVVYELGGAPALKRLQELLQGMGETRGRHAARFLQVGLAIDEHRARFDRGDFLIRGVMGLDQPSGGLVLSDRVHVGQTLQFHVRDPNAATEDLNMLLTADRLQHRDDTPHAALLFSCNGRGRRFFSHPHHDVAIVRDRLGTIPIAGFFAAGEIGPVSGKNFLHGYTASLALFCERRKPATPASELERPLHRQTPTMTERGME